VLNQSLKHNICNLDINVTYSPPEEPRTIQHSLRYSCMHWASHLAHVLGRAPTHDSLNDIQDLLSVFVAKHLLHGVECLSMLRDLESGVKLLYKASEVMPSFSKKHGGFKGILPILEDACRFLQFAFVPIKKHPLEIYHPALVWLPEKSLTRERYANAFRCIWNSVTGKQEAILGGHRLHPIRMAFSHEGDFLVSGSWDKSTRVWNVMMYETQRLLSDHSGPVISIARVRK
jgi:WD domain, G-beta repeat